jgi:hypothetical protein
MTVVTGTVTHGAPAGASQGDDQLCYYLGVTSPKPPIEALDLPMVPFAVGGMAAFAVALLVVWLAGGPSEWQWICVAGFLAGIPGLLVMLRHDVNRRRRRALTHPEFTVTD